ncbi:MAG TPA: DUF86 domain-containing protein [Methanocorpusculum sp.]|nr:DUF86 domain-containing protein [Methanocorpusculum sp.]
MRRDTNICLQHIYDRSDRILKIAQFVSYDEFKQNFILHDAVIRSFEVIGEAAHGLSRQYQAQHPDVPFRQFGQLRNFLIHEYFSVDLRRVWMIVRKDLPSFHDQVGKLLGVK